MKTKNKVFTIKGIVGFDKKLPKEIKEIENRIKKNYKIYINNIYVWIFSFESIEELFETLLDDPDYIVYWFYLSIWEDGSFKIIVQPLYTYNWIFAVHFINWIPVKND